MKLLRNITLAIAGIFATALAFLTIHADPTQYKVRCVLWGISMLFTIIFAIISYLMEEHNDKNL